MGLGPEDPFVQNNLPTVGEIRACIPKEVFHKSVVKSLAYWIYDLTIVFCLYKLVPFFEQAGILGLLLWICLQGTALTAIFVIGHDCGHGSFSDYTWLNDIVGHLTHGMIFAPYWPWQKSHRMHHMYTSLIGKDKGHGWTTEAKYKETNPIVKFFKHSATTAPFRWFIYTAGGLPDGSHFWPGSELFTNTKERIQCCVSAAVCFFFAYIAYTLCGGPLPFFKLYICPLLVMSSWMIIITYMQHQTDDIQVFENGNWNFLKGQLQTIDRPYGFYFDEILHNITDGHVAHHLFFTAIPHYNLKKATEAIQKKLEPFGVYRKQNSFDFIWRFNALSNRLLFLVGEGTGKLMYETGQKEE